MTARPPTLAAIEAALEDAGLAMRGAFHPGPDDGAPPLPDGRATATLVLAGNAGPGMWEAFASAPEIDDGGAHSLDRWARRVLAEIADALEGGALFPSVVRRICRSSAGPCAAIRSRPRPSAR